MMNSAYVLVPPGPKASEHSGQWTLEEKRWADALAVEFAAGTLDIEEGVSLRRFLSQALNCSPKRISKKYEKSHYNGKLLYKKTSKNEDAETDEIKARKGKLQALEHEYRESLKVLKMVEDSRQTPLRTTFTGTYGNNGPAPNGASLPMSPLYALQQVGMQGQQDIVAHLKAQRQRLSQLQADLVAEQSIDSVLQAFKKTATSSNGPSGDTVFAQRLAFEAPWTPLEVAQSNDSLLEAYRATAGRLDGSIQGLNFPQVERTWSGHSHVGNASTGLASFGSGSASPNIQRILGKSLGGISASGLNRRPSSASAADPIGSVWQGFLVHQMQGKAAILPLSLSTLRSSSSSIAAISSGEKNAKRARQNALLLAALTKNRNNGRAGLEGAAKRKKQDASPPYDVAARKHPRL